MSLKVSCRALAARTAAAIRLKVAPRSGVKIVDDTAAVALVMATRRFDMTCGSTRKISRPYSADVTAGSTSVGMMDPALIPVAVKTAVAT